MTLAVARITDPREVNRILHDPSVAGKLTRDDAAPGYRDHPLISYTGAFDHGRLVGVFVSARVTRYEVEAHAAILPCAMRVAGDFADLFLLSVFRDEAVQRVFAPVLATLPSAANWCRKLGFRDEGVKRAATRIGDKPVDVILLGMTREDWLARTVSDDYRERDRV